MAEGGGSRREERPETRIGWPRSDYSRVPFRYYHDAELYKIELDRIFKGPVWSYIGLEAEIPNAGDFRTSYIGETPIIVTCDDNGEIRALVNRCAHRGALVRREPFGNAKEHICIYHRWCYASDGRLLGLPFRHGLRGKGGMGADFKLEDHGLERLRVARRAGVLFATFRDETEPLDDYLGPIFRGHIDRVFHKPIRILGYQHQRVSANWKLYAENTRDTYHGSLLHEFQSTFGMSRITQTGGVTMDSRHRHNLTWTKLGTDSDAEFTKLYQEFNIHESDLRLTDPAFVKYHPEYDDGVSTSICSIFPSTTVHQITNCLGTRHLRPIGPKEFEIKFTLFGYVDDSEEMTRHRLLQANFVGPAGLISMEDGEAIEITHKATVAEHETSAVVEIGGRGPILNLEHRVNDMPVRGFWSFYSELMGIEPEGAER